MDLKSKIILISGPTASGKSKFAIKLAKKVKGEIINADSMQVYKEFKILTARPSIKEYSNVKHHLYGFQNVKINFSTGEWLKLAKKKITEIRKRKKIPILVGGTGLYFKSLIDGFVEIPSISLLKRKKIRELQKDIGQEKFFKKLVKLDPTVLGKISSTDTQRSLRAYEVKYFTKKSINYWHDQTKPSYDQSCFIKILVEFPKNELNTRISNRVNQMIKKGAEKEVKNFMKLKVRKDLTSNKIIGVKEINEYLEGKIDENQMINLINIKTRQYAKKQRTWSRGNMKSWKVFQIKKDNLKNLFFFNTDNITSRKIF